MVSIKMPLEIMAMSKAAINEDGGNGDDNDDDDVVLSMPVCLFRPPTASFIVVAFNGIVAVVVDAALAGTV